MLAFHVKASTRVPASLLPSQLPTKCLETQWEIVWVGPYHLWEVRGRDSWLLNLVCLGLAVGGHLWGEPVDRKSLVLFTFPFFLLFCVSNKETSKSINESLFKNEPTAENRITLANIPLYMGESPGSFLYSSQP